MVSLLPASGCASTAGAYFFLFAAANAKIITAAAPITTPAINPQTNSGMYNFPPPYSMKYSIDL